MADVEAAVRTRSYDAARLVEVVLYAALGLLLAVGAAVTVVATCATLWNGIVTGNLMVNGFHVLDQLLLVLIFAEILHTVRISIRSESLVMEPFLVVGLIGSVRRVLVITMQAAKTVQEGQTGPMSDVLFRDSMIELAILGVLILIFVISIHLLGRVRTPEEAADSGTDDQG